MESRAFPAKRLTTLGAAALALALGLGAAAVVAPQAPLLQPATAQYAIGSGPAGAPNDPAHNGYGFFNESIDWIIWEPGPSTVTQNGVTRHGYKVGEQAQGQGAIIPVDGGTLQTKCTATVTAGAVRHYASGEYSGDGFAQLYRAGSTYRNNTMTYALANIVDGSGSARDDSFTFSCAAQYTPTSGGSAVTIPLQGLVFADAESSNKSQDEKFWVEAPNSAVRWQILERYRSLYMRDGSTYECPTSVNARFINNMTLELGSNGTQCSEYDHDTRQNSTVYGSGPTAVAFMKGATSANVSLRGGGTSAIALGVVLNVDYGDAPYKASTNNSLVDGMDVDFGKAGAILNPTWTGGEITSDSEVFSLSRQTGSANTKVIPASGGTNTLLGGRVDKIAVLNTNSAAPFLGLGVTPDGDYPAATTPANADTLDDGPTNTVTLTKNDGSNYLAGEQFNLAITCTPRANSEAPVVGWIDWNQNGKFEQQTEQSSQTICANSTGVSQTVTLRWTVPADVNHGGTATATYMRLRIGGAENKNKLTPTGLTMSGEVEDYRIERKVPVQTVAKKVEVLGNGAIANGAQVKYTVSFENVGNKPFSALNPASITDNISNVLRYGDIVSGPTLTSTPNTPTLPAPQLDVANKKITWNSGAVNFAVGRKVSFTYTVQLKNITNQNSDVQELIRNVAWASNHIDAPQGLDKCPSANTQLDVAKAKFIGLTAWCAETELKMPAFEVSKTSDPETGTIVNSGQEVQYTLTFKNVGFARGALAYTDILTGVLDDAELLAGGTYGANGIRVSNTAVSAVLGADKKLQLRGVLNPGSTVTVNYTVRVKDTGLGDYTLGNVLTSGTETTCPEPQDRQSSANSDVYCTEHPVGKPSLLTITKVEKDSSGAVISTEAEGWNFSATTSGSSRFISDDLVDRVTGTTESAKTLGWLIRNESLDSKTITVTEDPTSKQGFAPVGHYCQVTAPTQRHTSVKTSYTYTVETDGLLENALSQDGKPTATVRNVEPGSAVDCVFVNQQKTGSVSWTKVSAIDPTQLLAGSTWELRKVTGGTQDAPETSVLVAEIEDCAPQDGQATTDCADYADKDPKLGTFLLEGLDWGNYQLVETAAPIGFVIADEPFPFSIGPQQDGTFELEFNLNAIENRSRAVLAVPHTGGLGSWSFPLYGVAIAGLSFLAFGVVRKRKAIA